MGIAIVAREDVESPAAFPTWSSQPTTPYWPLGAVYVGASVPTSAPLKYHWYERAAVGRRDRRLPGRSAAQDASLHVNVCPGVAVPVIEGAVVSVGESTIQMDDTSVVVPGRSIVVPPEMCMSQPVPAGVWLGEHDGIVPLYGPWPQIVRPSESVAMPASSVASVVIVVVAPLPVASREKMDVLLIHPPQVTDVPVRSRATPWARV